MEAKVFCVGDVTVVSMKGKLSIEESIPFKEACFKNFKNKKVVFCMRDLSFVGSSGIQNFFSVLRELNSQEIKGVKLAGVNKDFKRVMEYSKFSDAEIFEQVDTALLSFEEATVSK